jgi:O-antigen ligase
VEAVRDKAEGSFTPSAYTRRASGPDALHAGQSLMVGAAVVTLGWFHGGYAPSAWGWSALLALWVIALALLFRSQVLVDPGALAFVGLLAALTGWTGLSAAWSLSVPRTMLEVERDLVYVACVGTVVVLARATRPRVLLGGLLGGLVALVAYALGSYVISFPAVDATQGYLLFRPVGYANALGGLSALALPPVLAVAVHDLRGSLRAMAGAATVVLSGALFLTQNRAAWLAVGVALVVWILRTRAPEVTVAGVLMLAIPAGSALAVVASLGLLDTHAQPVEIASGRATAGVVVLALAAVAAALAGVVRPRRPTRTLAVRGVRVGSVLVVAASMAAVSRLGDRAHYWRAAWRAFEQHPVVGSGAGTFDVQWFRYRDLERTVRDAHNLYLGTASELGLVGLALLVTALVLPIVSARRTRDPLLTAVLASYCGFLVHLAFEWDWKFPVLVGSALVIAATLVVADAGRSAIRIRGATRVLGAAAALIAAVFVVAAWAGNNHVVAAEGRMVAGDADGAVAQAKRARGFVPWASEPWLVIADSRTRNGDAGGARIALREAVRRDPNDWTLWIRLAAVAHADERALAVRRALALNPLLAAR